MRISCSVGMPEGLQAPVSGEQAVPGDIRNPDWWFSCFRGWLRGIRPLGSVVSSRVPLLSGVSQDRPRGQACGFVPVRSLDW